MDAGDGARNNACHCTANDADWRRSFSADSAGNAGTQLWNTLGADSFPNLYLFQPPTNTAFYNSGNGTAASINVPLSTGIYAFGYRAEPTTSEGAWMELNLFFDGNNSEPKISVLAPLSSSLFAAANSSRPGSTIAGILVR